MLNLFQTAAGLNLTELKTDDIESSSLTSAPNWPYSSVRERERGRRAGREKVDGNHRSLRGILRKVFEVALNNIH